MNATPSRNVRQNDIAELSSVVGTEFRVLGRDRARNDVVLDGDYRLMKLRPGLVLHATDTQDHFDLNTEIVQRDGMTCYLFLDGNVDASIGDRPLNVGRCGREVEAVMVSRARPDLFQRHSHRGAHIRKVNVSINEEWLEDCGFNGIADHREVSRFAHDHLAERRWRPSARLIALAEQILHPPAYAASLQSLYLESRAIEIITEALLAISHADAENTGSTPREHARLRLSAEFIDAHIDTPLTLSEIAREAGTSPNTLQRIFQAAYGVSVFEYIRGRKLDRARLSLERDGISVTEAAFLAGYSTSANFATAFKKRFGTSPKHVRARL
jgi:AraC-like DNA-binding protein